MSEAMKRSKLPWIVGAVTLFIALCACAGGVGGLLWWRASETEDEAARAEQGVGEWLAVRQAALSHKVHNDPFSAPSGHEVHINQSEVLGPSSRDTLILNDLLSRRLSGPEALDVLPDQGFAANLYQEDGAGSVTRVTLDLDRDGKLDEQWKVEGTRVRRAVSTKDDETYDQMWLWQNGLWLKR